MSDKGKAWKKPRTSPMAYRRSRGVAVQAYRSAATVDVPLASGGEPVLDAIRQCNRKRPYPEQHMAERIAVSSAERGFRVRAYPCPHCGQWHVGSYAG
jgi:hypothetical protein